ncbi:catalase, partial [Phenoliferia sp. Uapishka_3]
MSFSGDGVAQHSRPSSLTNSAKVNQLERFTVRVPLDGDAHVSPFAQAKVDNLDTSMRAGSRGPTSIDDPVARERIQHCKPIPMFVRFSTVLGSSGAAETAREVRGFATRFYTDEGNWDIVGNNIPVFFIQDGIKFIDLIHAGKPEPQLAIPQAQTAHDSFWDWMSLTPETTNMAAWSLSDYTIPRSYRMMKGFGVNTYVLVNAEGKRTFTKFHWKPHLGTHALTWDECLKLQGHDPDFLRRDLAEAIEAGAYPKWELGVQLISEEEELTFDFDILDCTKAGAADQTLILHQLVPIKWIGTMELNKNPTNYFAETEQVAFCTSNVVPGIDYSNDPMLQLRNFSYADTQITRLGGPNYPSLPINRSLCPFISTARDGMHQHRIPAGPHYYPNRFETPNVEGMKHGAGQNYATSAEKVKEDTKINPERLTFAPYQVEGTRGKTRPARFAEVVNHAQMFYNSLSDVERQHMVDAAQFELGHCDDRGVQERMMMRFNEIDHDFAKKVALGFGINVDAPKHPNHGKKTHGAQAFSMQDSENVFTATGRKIGIFVLDGFDSLQVAPLIAGLTALGCIPQLIGSRKGPAYPSGTSVGDLKASGVLQTNWTIESCRSTLFDALYFPSGDEAYAKALEQGRVIHFVREAFGHFKPIAAIGVAVPWVAHKCLPGCLDVKADISKPFTSNKGLVLGQNLTDEDSSLWTKLTTGPKDVYTFGSAFIDAVAAHRHWDRDISMVAF